MRHLTIGLICVCVLAAVGCNKVSSQWPSTRNSMNAWMVDEYRDESIRNGILAEHTIYPHHFVKDSSELNELGVHDLAILAEHFATDPGSLNVRRGAVGDELYDARVASVKHALTEHGVDVDRIAINDAPAGGDGMVSDFVVVVINEKMDKPLTPDKTVSGFFSGTGASR